MHFTGTKSLKLFVIVALEQSSCEAHVTNQVIVKCFKLDNASKWNVKVSMCAKIRNRYNQVPHLTQDTNGKVTNSQ